MAMPKVLDWLDDLVAQVATNVTNIAKNASDIAANKALFDTHTADDNRHWTTEDRQNFDRTIHFKGYFISLDKLKEAYPTAELGDYAIVGGTDTVWVWDDETNTWLNSTEQGIVISVNGRTGEVILTKTDVGLSNVDNTSDANKPVSTAQQAALDNKADRGLITAAQADSNTLRSGIYYLNENYTILGDTTMYWSIIHSEALKKDGTGKNTSIASQIWINFQTNGSGKIYYRRQQFNYDTNQNDWSDFKEILTSTHLATLNNTISEMQTNIQTNATGINNLSLNKADRKDISLTDAEGFNLTGGIYSIGNQYKTIMDVNSEFWTVIVGKFQGNQRSSCQIWIDYQNGHTGRMFLRTQQNWNRQTSTWSDFTEILTTNIATREDINRFKQYKGYYAQLSDLKTAFATATDGDYAIVGSALYIWNSKTSSWTEVSGSGGSTGSGKWSIKQYDTPDITTQQIPYIKTLVNKTLEQQWEIDDTNQYFLHTNIYNYKHFLFETWVNMNQTTTITTTNLLHDDGINIYINGSSIYSTEKTSNATNVTSISFSLNKGWNKVQIILCEVAGEGYFKLGVKISDNVNCLGIDCYHSENDLIEGYVPLVGDSTIEGDVTVEGVVGVTSNAYLSYDSEEDSLSFSFAGKPEGERGNYSNPMSIENWNKLTAQVEKNTNDLKNNYVKYTDYANSKRAGVIRANNDFGFNVTASGEIYINAFDYLTYLTLNRYMAISKETLENVITGKELANKTYVDEISGEINEELQLECKRLREDNQAIAIPGQATGENITLNDSSDARFKKFEISGNHSQETREGYNKFNPKMQSIEFSSGTKITKNLDNTYKLEGGANNRADLLIIGTFDVTEGETYTLSGGRDGNNALSFRREGTILASTGDIRIANYTATQTETLNIYLRYQSVDTIIYKPMVLKGTYTADTIPPYEPYGASPSPEFESPVKTVGQNGSVEINVCNKNIFDGEIEEGIINQNTGENQNYQNRCRSKNYTKVKSNTNYYISQIYKDDYSFLTIYLYDDKLNYLGFIGNTAQSEKAFNSGLASYIKWKSNTSMLSIDGVQIEEGLMKTDYIPHQSQTKVLPIQQEMLEGDYIDDKEYHRWGKVVFDKNSDIICERSGYGAFTFQFLKKLENTDNLSQTICNLSKSWKNSWGESGCFVSWQGYFYLLCKENEFGFNTDMTTDEALLYLREILTQTNLVVYYTYSSDGKPKTIALELTEEQKKVKKEIDDTLHTYKNTTHISISSGEINAIANVEYLKDTQAYIDNQINTLQAMILAGEE